MREVKYLCFKEQFETERVTLLPKIEEIFARGDFIGGQAIQDLEYTLSQQLDREVVALSSGTDALKLALKALNIGPGDEVITVSNSFVATVASIIQVGATPVLIDVLSDQNMDPQKIEAAITKKTKAILPVHLTGRMCRMDEIQELASKHGLFVIEDAAQAFGSKRDNKLAGTCSDIGCFSAHPLKNLNAAGDAGFVACKSPKHAERIRRLRNHGLEGRDTVLEFSTVARMDTLQAVVLLHRLESLSFIIEARRRNANYYASNLNQQWVMFPESDPRQYDSFHTFVIQVSNRDALRSFLSDQKIETKIHYPIPVHMQPAANKNLIQIPEPLRNTEKQARDILSLPIHPFLTQEDLDHVIQSIHGFYKSVLRI